MTVTEKTPACKRRVYDARKFLARDTTYLKERVHGTFGVLFEDGKEVEMTATQLVINSHFWDIHRQLPWLPVISEHCVNTVLKGQLLSSSTHRQLFERIFWYIHDTALEKGIPFNRDTVDRINEMVYRKSNELYNHACLELERFVISTDLEDYYDLLNYPPMKAVIDNLQPNESSIAESYAEATRILLHDPGVASNDLAISARSGTVKISQLLQCIVCRGYVTDIDSKIFPEPSMGCYVRGFADYYSLMTDTRTAAKSLYFSATLLRMSEYNSRKLQLLCQSVMNLHMVDCGSQQYLHYKLAGPVIDENGRMTNKGDMHRFAGMYFLNEDTGKLQELKPNDTQYLGKILKFRSPLNGGCAHPDPHGICMMCYGSSAITIPEGTNIGYTLTAALMQILSQSILGVKHIDSSSSAAKAVLTPYQKKYLEVSSNGMSYHFAKRLNNKTIQLTISEDQMPVIASLQSTGEFDGVSPAHFSELNNTLINVINPKNMADDEQMPLSLSNEKRNAFFTREALQYIREKGWTRVERNIVIDFTDWDNTKPFATLPHRHFNNADHAKDIADLIQGSSSKKEDSKKRRQEGSPVDYFMDLYTMVNSRLDVPAIILQMIVYGASIRNAAQEDYRLPKAGTGNEMGLSDRTIPRRSMGPGMGFERHVQELFQTTKGYNPQYTSSHPMDVFVLPREAVADAKRRGLR